MGTKKVRTEVRQSQILHSALQIVSEKGLQELNMVQLAERVGVVPSAVYRHFAKKEQVLDGIIDLIETRLLENVAKARSKPGDSLQCLKRILEQHAELLVKNPGIPRLIFSEEFYNSHPERRQRVYQMIRKYLQAIAEIIKQGQRNREIRLRLDAETLALHFLGIIQPAAILMHMSGGEFNLKTHVRKAWKILHDCIQEK
jgi:AcrR family transcriptional regulator